MKYKINFKKLQFLTKIAVFLIIKPGYTQNLIQLDLISIGSQFQSNKIHNSKYENIDRFYIPSISSSISFQRKLNPKISTGLKLIVENGSLNRIFDYEHIDSNGKFDYKSNFKINFISYGIGIISNIHLKNKVNLNFNVNYMRLSTQGFGGKEEWINTTSNSIEIFREDRFNEFYKNKNFIQIGVRLEKFIGKKNKHSVSISCDKTFQKPLIGGLTFRLNSIEIENTDFKINYAMIRFGYSIILFKN